MTVKKHIGTWGLTCAAVGGMVGSGWLFGRAVAPIETLALIQYADNYFPWLMHTVHQVHVLSKLGILIAVSLLFVMCLLNVFGVRLLTKTNIVVVVLKLIVPILTVIFLFIYAFHS